MKVVVLTGMPGSGKSTAVDLAKGRGIPVFRMGDDVWDETKARGLTLTKENVQATATEMRKAHGPAIWAKRTIERVRKVPASYLVIIDGSRSYAEVEAFRKEFGNDLVVVAIIASLEPRFERLRSRGRTDDIRTLEDLKARDEQELGWGLGEVISNAERVIENEGPLEDVQKEVELLLKELMG